MIKKKKNKILFLSRQIGTTGGAERRLLKLLDSSLNGDFNLISYSFMGNLDIYIDKPESRLIRNLFYIKRLFKLWYFILKEKPNLIHTFDLESGIYIKIIQRYLLTIRYSKLIIGYGASKIDHIPTSKILSRKGFQPDAYTCNSEAGKISLLKILPQPAPPLYLIYNGIDRVSPQEKVPKWRTENNFIVGCISKFDDNKKGERIFDLAEYIGKINKNIHFVFIGTGGNFKEWKLFYDSHRNRFSNLTLLGVVDDAIKLVEYFDVGILFSDNEGFPNAILEYMLYGKPTLTTSAGEVKTIIKNGENGIVIDCFDVKIFGQAIIEMHLNPELRQKLGLNAQKNVFLNFTFDQLTKKLDNLYREILELK